MSTPSPAVLPGFTAVAELRRGRGAGAGAATAVRDAPVVTLAACIAVAATVWALAAAGYADGGALAMAPALLGVVSVAAAASIARRRHVPSLLLLALVLLCGAAALVATLLPSMPDDGGSGVRHAAARLATAIAGGTVVGEGWTFVAGLCGVTWLLGVATARLSLGRRAPLLGALPCTVALVVNAVAAPLPSGAATAQAVAAGALLLLVAATRLATLRRSAAARMSAVMPRTGPRFTAVAVVMVILAVGVSALLPPLSTRGLVGALPGQGPIPAQVTFSASVEPGGALVDDPAPVLTYTTDGGDSVYLRAAVDTVLDRGSWYPDDGPAEAQVRVGPGSITRQSDAAQGGMPPAAVSRRVQVTMTVRAAATASQHLALFGGEPVEVSQRGTATGYSDAEGSLLTVDSVDLGAGWSGGELSSVGLVSTATAAQLDAAGTDYPAWVLRFAGLPGASRPEDRQEMDAITALAHRWTAAATTPYQRATLIEQHLRADYAYTLTPPRVPAGRWAIAWFLLEGRAGYCQYFASSMATMLRALDIPARVVSGYGPGTVVGGAGTAQAVHQVRTSDAHAWVEAYFPGYGWIPFEPTPGSAQGAYEPFARGGSAGTTPAPSNLPTSNATPRRTPSSSAEPSPGTVVPPPSAAPPGGPLLPAALATALAAVVSAALLLTMRWFARPRSADAAWRRVLLLALLLRVRGRAGETDARFVRRLAERIRGRDTADDLLVVAGAVDRRLFAAAGAAGADDGAWRAAWLRLCRRLPRLAWERVRG